MPKILLLFFINFLNIIFKIQFGNNFLKYKVYKHTFITLKKQFFIYYFICSKIYYQKKNF